MTAAPQWLRPDLPPLPAKMRRLQLDARGYPVPWFVDWVDGKPDFRIMDGRKLARILRGEKRCWICGGPLGSYLAFVVGPMCAVNRISGEPPSHYDCAHFAAVACPFLTMPKAKRREANKPADAVPPAGTLIARNPGVALIWVTKKYEVVHTGQKQTMHHLFEMGKPERVECYAEGRKATREEIAESVESGLPFLEGACDLEHPNDQAEARQELAKQLVVARTLLGIA